MRRVVLVPADLTGEALNELKQWLGISRDSEDANLLMLLKASLEMCEGFLGQRPLIENCEEQADNNSGWISLSANPVKAIISIEKIAEDGARTPLDVGNYTQRICADGIGQFRLNGHQDANVLAVQFQAGIANDWASMPGALRHGIIRLAAFHYRERDSAKTIDPPVSVTALWRPWRKVRIT